MRSIATSTAASRTASLPVICLFLTALAAGCAGRTLDDAADEALALVDLEAELGVLVFASETPVGPDRDLRPWARLVNDDPAFTPRSPPASIPIEDESWLFWIDDAPGARFGHGTRFVLVPLREGAPPLVVDADAWPVLDGESLFTLDYPDGALAGGLPAGLDGEDPPPDTEQRGDDGPERGDTTGRSGTPGPARRRALVIDGWEPDETGGDDMAKDATNMDNTLTAAGFQVTQLGPAEGGPAHQDGVNGYEARDRWFDQQSKELRAGDTLVVYVSAHGNIFTPGEEPSSLDGQAFADSVVESTLASQLGRIDPAVTIIVMIDACHSGGFADGLECTADLFLSATSEGKSSYSDLDGPDDLLRDEGGEFTSSVAQGIRNLLLGETSGLDSVCAEAEIEGAGFMEQVFQDAWENTRDWDAGATKGWSEPFILHGDPAKVRPEGTTKATECLPPDDADEPTYDGCLPYPEPGGYEALDEAIRFIMSDDGAVATETDVVGDWGACDAPCGSTALFALESGACGALHNVTPHSDGLATTTSEYELDIRYVGGLKANLGVSLTTDAWGNTDFPCGTNPSGVLTLCAEPTLPLPAGDWIFVWQVLDAPLIAASKDDLYTYAFVFDADDNDANNYVPSPAYPNDFFADTDLWFTADYDPATGWSLSVTDIRGGGFPTVASAARLMTWDGMILLAVPATELATPLPEFRATAFRHKGDFGMQEPRDWGADLVPAVGEPLLRVKTLP